MELRDEARAGPQMARLFLVSGQVVFGKMLRIALRQMITGFGSPTDDFSAAATPHPITDHVPSLWGTERRHRHFSTNA
jgi:hypothetical protein